MNRYERHQRSSHVPVMALFCRTSSKLHDQMVLQKMKALRKYEQKCVCVCVCVLTHYTRQPPASEGKSSSVSSGNVVTCTGNRISLAHCSLLAVSVESGEGSRVALSSSSVAVALPPDLANPQKPVRGIDYARVLLVTGAVFAGAHGYCSCTCGYCHSFH